MVVVEPLGGGLDFMYITIAHAGGTPSLSSNKTPDRTTLNPHNGQNSIMDKPELAVARANDF